MKSTDIRRTFLEFYRERGHKIVPSASLVPDDPTLLLTVAGMVPFKPYFSGQKPIEFPRAASVQKCARTNDIENVGVTARHQTLFEMLGNFSFGDYFKREAIAWAWEVSTEHFGLDPNRLWATVYEDDDEAYAIWRDEVGFPEARIVRRGTEDNLWWMGVAGPGGPTSELFYDRREPYGESAGFDDGDDVMEIYNIVFTDKQVDDSGAVIGDLPRKNVDTGLGLERLAQVLQGVATAYETDLFRPIIARAEDLTGRRYGAAPTSDTSLRIMAEHARSAMFLIGDGVLPSNEGRGYVLRRLLRRAVRHARLLGTDDPVLASLAGASIDVMGEAYPEVATGRAFIEQVVGAEEEHFRGTLRHGLTLLETSIGGAPKGSALGGDVAFKLHDTYGFPFELTVEIAQEAGLLVDADEFKRLMTEQRDRARGARKGDTGAARDDALGAMLASFGPTDFIGYENDSAETTLLGFVRDGEAVTSACEGDEVEIVLDRTPFYPEGGGQVGDEGVIETRNGARAVVLDTTKRLDMIVHRARVLTGELIAGAPASASVDAARRAATMRSHTATHILHATLRAALGEHARQAGSLVAPGRLRFDFSHFEQVPRALLDEVEETVNARLGADDGVRPYETTMDEARNRGALMLFEEKYGDIVRVVEIGDYSIELCGGIHVTRTSAIGVVKILGEASIGSNLRRIEALTGAEAVIDFRRSRAVLDQIAALLKTSPEDAPVRVEKLLADLKHAEAAVRAGQGARERDQATDLARAATRIGVTNVVVAEVPGLAVDALQRLALAVREVLGPPVAVVVASSLDGRAGIVAAVDKATAGSGVKARALIDKAAKAIGGGAGGKDEVATGGGGNAGALAEALRLASEAAREVLGS